MNTFTHEFSSGTRLIGLCAALATPGCAAFAQTNVVINGSFEGPYQELQPWQADTGVGHQVGYPNAAHGVNWIYFAGTMDSLITNLVPILGTNYLGQPSTNGWEEVVLTEVVPGNLWQDLATVPGRSYDYSFQSGGDGTQVRAYWNNQVVGEFGLTVEQGWFKTNFQVVATAETTRIRVENLTGWQSALTIDDFRVGWLQEPPSIAQQPVGRSGFVQQTARFATKAGGREPLRYQWLFNDAALVDETNSVLTIEILSGTHAGGYSVAVENDYGSVTSRVAQLYVEPVPATPIITAQPVSLPIPEGYLGSLNCAAAGAPPLVFQWFRNGAPVNRGTNATLAFQPVTQGDAGTYVLRVSNGNGEVISLPAEISVSQFANGGHVAVRNRENSTGLTRPVYDADGVTKLVGTNFLTQVYVGRTLEQMRPAGNPMSFFAASFPAAVHGIFFSSPAAVPDIPEGETVLVQLKVWNVHDGATYEAARGAGGKFGFSSVMQTTTYRIPSPPVELLIPESFSLQSGMPLFSAGRLYAGERLPGGGVEWELHGEAGFRYLLERRSLPNNWQPFGIITNTSGISVFDDPSGSEDAVRFYRARMLD